MGKSGDTILISSRKGVTRQERGSGLVSCKSQKGGIESKEG